MTRGFADSYNFLALVSRRDQAHDWARAIAALPNLQIVTTSWVLTEVADGMAVATHRMVAVRLITGLQDDTRVDIIPPSPEQFQRAFALYGNRHDKNWSLTDCSSFVVMQQMGLTHALTGDKHFEQAGFQLFTP